MATPRKIVSPLKEKKVASPSPTPTKTKTSSTTTGRKQIPNYLKPTASSSGVVDHPPMKKPGISSSKPDLNRRRSFDKPPSSSLIHKKSPTTLRNPSPVLSRTKSSPKPLLKKIIPSSSSARANTGMKKTNSTVLSANEKEIKIEVGNSKKEDEALLVNDIEGEVKVVETNENRLVGSEIPIVNDPSTSEDAKTCDLDNENKLDVDVEIEGVGEKVLVEEVADDNDDEKKEGGNDNVEKEATEAGEDEEKEEGKGDQKEKEDDGSEINNDVQNDDVVKVGESSKIASKEEDSGKGGEDVDGKDRKGKEVTSEARNARGETAKEEAQHQVHYNDVIEETKTKLLEKRKNKVLALVGAFETVISLEEP